MTPSLACTIEEMMIVAMSREVNDGDVVGVGALSPIPAAASILAQQTHAPNAEVLILGSDDYFPFVGGTSQFHYLAQRGQMDVFFASGIQIDGQGNFNLNLIGDHASPKLRMPGAYGTAMFYYMAKRTVLFRTEHTRRTFVEKVDFVTGAGVTPENVYRLGGPTRLITPMAVLAFGKKPAGWRLESAHPGCTPDEVQDNTGFRLKIRTPVKITPLPSREALRTLRTDVREKLARIYPEFAEEKIGREA